MSAASLQKKINKAYTKVGNKIGFTFNVYRPTTNINVLADTNIIGTTNLSVSLNEQYSNTIDEQTPIWTTYCDYDLVQEGDFVYSEEQNRTFLIITKKPHLPILSIELPDRISIKQVGYSNAGFGFEPNDTTYLAQNIPAFITYSSRVKNNPSFGDDAVVGVRKMEVYTHLPVKLSLINEAAVDYDGFKGTIVQYDYPFLGAGTKITVQESGTQ